MAVLLRSLLVFLVMPPAIRMSIVSLISQPLTLETDDHYCITPCVHLTVIISVGHPSVCLNFHSLTVCILERLSFTGEARYPESMPYSTRKQCCAYPAMFFAPSTVPYSLMNKYLGFFESELQFFYRFPSLDLGSLFSHTMPSL